MSSANSVGVVGSGTSPEDLGIGFISDLNIAMEEAC